MLIVKMDAMDITAGKNLLNMSGALFVTQAESDHDSPTQICDRCGLVNSMVWQHVFARQANGRLSAPSTIGRTGIARYIALLNWTDQGIKNVKESPARLDAARAAAKKIGVEIKDFYMTIGAYDMAIVTEAPDDEAMARFVLATGMGGNVRTTTMKAFTEDAYRKIIGGL